MHANYFFVDGSALTAQIRQLQKAQPAFSGRKLCTLKFLEHFLHELIDLHEGQYKRAIFYFPVGDEAAIEDYLIVPDHKQPGNIRDLHFKFCGQKLKKSAEFDQFVVESVPAKFHSRFSKSEKGIDIEMCCDGLKLASASRLERLFLLSNDGDFIPFCRTIKEFGANISIIHLSGLVTPNVALLREADSYDVISAKALHEMFLPIPAEVEPSASAEEIASAEKADEPGEATDATTTEEVEPSASELSNPKGSKADLPALQAKDDPSTA